MAAEWKYCSGCGKIMRWMEYPTGYSRVTGKLLTKNRYECSDFSEGWIIHDRGEEGSLISDGLIIPELTSNS